MSDHLPECYLSGPPNLCPTCEALRACEQRVLEDERALIAVEQTTLAELNAEYRKGLDAAREAVAAMPPMEGWKTRPVGRVDLVDKWSALAAIDALRGSGNPHTPPSAEKGGQA